MPKITSITRQKSNAEKLNIFVDYSFCVGIRERTFKAMGLDVGSEISCEKLKEMENFYWKKAYGEEAWRKEKVRIRAVKALIETIHSDLKVTTVGFGADTDELIEKHPDEKGKPDLDVSTQNNPDLIVKVEVTGTEFMRGQGYWVRPDKLQYTENHPNEDVWIVLHFAEPEEIFIFIKPISNKKYQRHTIDIRGAGEYMCIFNEGDEEIKSFEEFSAHVITKFGLT